MNHENTQRFILTRGDITALLEDLGRRRQERGVEASLYEFGGASIALTVDGRRSTDDIDAFIKPADVVLSAAREVARERGIPENWLNDAGRGFVPDSATWGEGWATGGLRVWNATPAMVLAMKHGNDATEGRRRPGRVLRRCSVCVGAGGGRRVPPLLPGRSAGTHSDRRGSGHRPAGRTAPAR